MRNSYLASRSLCIRPAAFRWATLLWLAFPLFGCDDTTSPLMGDPSLGTIMGTVKDEAEGPVAGASVRTAPASTEVVTDARGGFTLTVPLIRPRTYAVIVERAGYRILTTNVSLTLVLPLATIALRLVRETGPPPALSETTLRVRGLPRFDGPSAFVPGNTLPFDVEIQNVGPQAVIAVIHDTLDFAFVWGVQAGDVELNTAAFPNAQVVVHPDGFSFQVILGLVPVAGVESSFVRAYTVSRPTSPGGGVWCNRVNVEEAPVGTSTRHRDISCLAGTL